MATVATSGGHPICDPRKNAKGPGLARHADLRGCADHWPCLDPGRRGGVRLRPDRLRHCLRGTLRKSFRDAMETLCRLSPNNLVHLSFTSAPTIPTVACLAKPPKPSPPTTASASSSTLNLREADAKSSP